MSKIDLIDNGWVDLVFEGRNKEYGAYQLRKGTGKRNIWSIIIMLALAALIGIVVGVNAIIEANSKEEISADVELSKIIKKEAKVEKKAPVKIEEAKPVEKVKSSIKFVPPVIKKDSEVKPEEELRTQDDLNKSNLNVGALDVKGNSEDEGTVMRVTEVIAQPEEKPKEDNQIFTIVEQKPTFPGGDGALMSWLSSNIKYPVLAEENGIQGRVIVQFVVERDGSITDVQVVRGVDRSLDEEAKRVVKSMPHWIPGKQNGSAVRVRYTLPVTFKLQ
ncbi:MAG: energy transducer TonB [Prevotella sp.]|nr:energy transducer TonB [Prevotella sp.]